MSQVSNVQCTLHLKLTNLLLNVILNAIDLNVSLPNTGEIIILILFDYALSNFTSVLNDGDDMKLFSKEYLP